MERAVSAKLLRGVSVEAFLRYLRAGYVRKEEGAKNISYARTGKVCMVKSVLTRRRGVGLSKSGDF